MLSTDICQQARLARDARRDTLKALAQLRHLSAMV